MRHNILISAVVALVVAVSACASSSDVESSDTGTIDWSSCDGGWQCATVEVPLDAAEPDGATVSIAVTRLPAADPDARIGPLFVNFGGPSPAIGLARGFASTLSESMRDAFDLVAFDPRGLGESDAIDCDFDVTDLFTGLDYTPDSQDEFDAIVDANESFAGACAASDSAALLDSVDVSAIATDMDAIRAAMDEPQLSYLGFSWGTYVGQYYAELFPQQVRAMVLDGVIDPAASAPDAIRAQAIGFEDSLEAFLDWCARTPSCAFHPDDPDAAFADLVQQIDDSPVPAGDGELGPAEFDIGVASMLYLGADGYASLARMLAAAEAGRGAELYAEFEGYTGTAGPGDDGSYEGFLALSCGDTPSAFDVGELEQFADEVGADAPYFGPSTVLLSLPCATWPIAGSSVVRPVTAPGAPPILVVGTIGDPATPYAQAVAVSEQLESGVLVTWEGARHTAYGASACVNSIVDRYLLELTVPENGVVCKA